AKLAEAARRGAKGLLVFRWQALLGLERFALAREAAEEHAHAPCAHRQQIHLGERHQVTRAQEKPLHARRLGVVGDEELERVALIGGVLEDRARRREPLRKELVAL